MFYLIGGMPEVVKTWLRTSDYHKCNIIHHDILDTYQDDFKKYKSRISPLLLAQTLKSVALQAGSKFVYSRVQNDIESKSVKEALSLLSLSGLVIPVTHTAANGIPLGAEINPKFRKYLFVDTGLMLLLLDIQTKDVFLLENADLLNPRCAASVLSAFYSHLFNAIQLLPESEFR